VLGGKPTQIRAIVDVSLPRPRNHRMLLTKEFLKIKERVIRAYGK
jgi:ABC-type nitrate/sulfonate/bicarbonate transport system ATPase subunit